MTDLIWLRYHGQLAEFVCGQHLIVPFSSIRWHITGEFDGAMVRILARLFLGMVRILARLFLGMVRILARLFLATIRILARLRLAKLRPMARPN